MGYCSAQVTVAGPMSLLQGPCHCCSDGHHFVQRIESFNEIFCIIFAKTVAVIEGD